MSMILWYVTILQFVSGCGALAVMLRTEPIPDDVYRGGRVRGGQAAASERGKGQGEEDKERSAD